MDYAHVRVNDILEKEITKIGSTDVIDPNFRGDAFKMREARRKMCTILDDLGMESAREQNLKQQITSSAKLASLLEPQTIYLLKNEESNNGDGEVIGFLKTGYKNLYTLDNKNNSIQIKPLCILDFYIKPTYQRLGYGKKLFDYMLMDVNVAPEKLAIDAPSPKMMSFMKRHYSIHDLMLQCSNFAFSQSYFLKQLSAMEVEPQRNIPRTMYSRNGLGAMPRGRFANTPRSTCEIASVIHDNNYSSSQSAVQTDINTPATVSEVDNAEGEISAAAEAFDKLSLTTEAPDVMENPDSLEADDDRPAAGVRSRPRTPTSEDDRMSSGSACTHRSGQLTEKGYFDIKFYHNKLW